MRASKFHNLLVIIFLCLVASPLQSHAASNKHKSQESTKERLVLMPIRVPEDDKSLTGAMETALVKGLQQKYDVYSGEPVSKKAHEIFMKESKNTAHKDCDEIRCMQNIAEAFQAELIAVANVTKQDGSYFLALSIQNIFDNKVVYSESLPCKNCDATQAVDRLKELSGVVVASDETDSINNSLFNIGDCVMPKSEQNPEKIVRIVSSSENKYTFFTHFYSEGRLIQAQDYQMAEKINIQKAFVKVECPTIDGKFSPDKYLNEKKK